MKLPYELGIATLEVAYVMKKRSPTLRLGQCIFNCLSVEMDRHFTGSEYDFYYWQDDEKVLDYYFEHYVEQCGE